MAGLTFRLCNILDVDRFLLYLPGRERERERERERKRESGGGRVAFTSLFVPCCNVF